jgi:hypothetical protein
MWKPRRLTTLWASAACYRDSLLSRRVRWAPCRHDVAHPQVADGGDGLQIWRESANISTKQSRTADRGGPPACGLGVGLITVKQVCYEMSRRASDKQNDKETASQPELSSPKLVLHRAYMRNSRYCYYVLIRRRVGFSIGTQNSAAISKKTKLRGL